MIAQVVGMVKTARHNLQKKSFVLSARLVRPVRQHHYGEPSELDELAKQNFFAEE